MTEYADLQQAAATMIRSAMGPGSGICEVSCDCGGNAIALDADALNVPRAPYLIHPGTLAEAVALIEHAAYDHITPRAILVHRPQVAFDTAKMTFPSADDVIARRVASARNYLMEATMGDYSMDSIRRGEADLATAKAEAAEAGLAFDKITAWNAERGCYEPVV